MATAARPRAVGAGATTAPPRASSAGLVAPRPRFASAWARRPSRSAPASAACASSAPSRELVATEKKVSAFAPATIANLGPGFDWLGCAVEGPGDTVIAELLPDRPGELVIQEIVGDGGRLSLVAEDNCVGIAARAALELTGAAPESLPGIGFRLHKGLPLGSGMGSSAASAAAAAAAVNALFGNPLTRKELVAAGLVSEGTVAGFHADNIAPAVLGGFVLIESASPLVLDPLVYGSAARAGSGVLASASGRAEAAPGRAAPPPPEGSSPAPLYFVLVNPRFEAPTAKMRAALPKTVPISSLVNNAARGGALVASILRADPVGLGAALSADAVVEPARAPLIPGFAEVKLAAIEAGAHGATISGAGPTAVAIVDDPDVGERVAEAMSRAFLRYGGLETNSKQVVGLDVAGARVV